MNIHRISSVLILFWLFGCRSVQPAPAPTVTVLPTLVFSTVEAPTISPPPTRPKSTFPEITTAKDHQTLIKGFKPTFIWLFWLRDGKKLLIGTQETGILVYDGATKKIAANFERDFTIQQLELSPDRKTLAVVVYPASSIRLLDAETGNLIRTIDFTYSWRSRGLTFSPDSTLLASLNQDGEIIVWDVATGKEIKKLPGEESGDYSMSTMLFDPDGKSLVASFVNGTYKVWDTSTWNLQRVFECEDITFSFSPDGSRFATIGGGSLEPAVWDFNSGTKLFDLSSTKPVQITAIDFDPRGNYIAASGRDANTITLYDANTGKPLRELAPGALPLAFSPDGTRLAAVHQGESVSEVIL